MLSQGVYFWNWNRNIFRKRHRTQDQIPPTCLLGQANLESMTQWSHLHVSKILFDIYSVACSDGPKSIFFIYLLKYGAEPTTTIYILVRDVKMIKNMDLYQTLTEIVMCCIKMNIFLKNLICLKRRHKSINVSIFSCEMC